MSDIYANVTIDIIRPSQTFPVFTKLVYEMRIPEDAPRGQLVGKVEMQNNASMYIDLLELIAYFCIPLFINFFFVYLLMNITCELLNWPSIINSLLIVFDLYRNIFLILQE